MRKISRFLLIILMVVLTAGLYPTQVFGDTPDYVSEVKIGMGKDSSEAIAALEGYTVIKTDLNKNAEGGLGSKGAKVVYLGYKTTSKKSEALTDLAVMNMKGGYDVQEYEALMDGQMKEQIIPFVENFLQTIDEYRANYKSKIATNKKRAQYMHDLLNNITDDDTNGAGLGDLLLNKTKFEMNDATYNALTDEEKNKHADILTLLAQGNGQAILLMQKLLTRAADPYESTWIERMLDTTYEDLIDSTGLSPTDAAKKLNKDYYDDAEIIAEKWDQLNEDLSRYDEAVAYLEKEEEVDIETASQNALELDENASADEIVDANKALQEEKEKAMELNEMTSIVALHDYLNGIEYQDGTLLDFFTQPSADITSDYTVLFPMVASLSDGQRAGLDFLTIQELVMVTETDVKSYTDSTLSEIKPQSVYEGVDRDIYKKGGVAITSDALRKKAAEEAYETGEHSFPTWIYIMMGLSAVTAVSFIATGLTKIILNSRAHIYTGARELSRVTRAIEAFESAEFEIEALTFNSLNRGKLVGEEVVQYQRELASDLSFARTRMAPTNSVCNKLMAGFGVAMVIFVAVTTYLSYKDMKDFYKVNFTPIPHYMIDEKDLIAYNEDGEKIILKNQTAYYKVVECNRSKDAEMFENLNVCADLNGDVGSQWLALYASKNENESPILASSFKVVEGSTEIPSGYDTGIHMFGSDTAYNLNNTLLIWNNSATKIFFYFKREKTKAPSSGSVFSTTGVALTGGLGILLGAGMSWLAMKGTKRKKVTE